MLKRFGITGALAAVLAFAPFTVAAQNYRDYQEKPQQTESSRQPARDRIVPNQRGQERDRYNGRDKHTRDDRWRNSDRDWR
jgi:hypothetical protein